MLKSLFVTLAYLGLAAAARAADTGEVVVIDGLKSAAPASWKKGQPTNQMQHAVFTLPKANGDKEDAALTVFFFGPGGGGGVDANIKRWQGMFKAPAAENAKTEKTKVGDVKVTTLDVSGTYLFKARPFDPNAKVEEKPDFRMIGVIFESTNGPYFMRLVGPAKTVESHKKGFDEWLKNFK
jgi:predicted RecA/RadA family phage recombinase